jgi:TldD protein
MWAGKAGTGNEIPQRRRKFRSLSPFFRVGLATVTLASFCYSQEVDPILRAMKDEMDRAKQLRIVSLDVPYYVEYRIEDTAAFSVAATLGALIGSTKTLSRIPTVNVRVGDYAFDNTNHVYSEAYAGSRYDPGQMPIENDYDALRHVLWLATDRAYKTAEDAIARKRSSIKNINTPDQLPDFSKAPAVQSLLPVQRTAPNEQVWKDRIIKLSSIFSGYPKVTTSNVDLQDSQSTNYVMNSEGSALRVPEDLAFVRVRASGLTEDGDQVRDSEVFQAFELSGLASESDMRKSVTAVAENVASLSQAPRGEAYDGPVLFEARAAAQLFAQLLGDNLRVSRKPISEPNRPVPVLPSELEGRLGSRLFPEWMDVVDDPTQSEFRGHSLLGHYAYDMEGVAPKPLPLVEKGVLKSYLLTRTPVYKGFTASNGRARMPGRFGNKEAGFGNLFVRASQTSSTADLKKKLIEMCQAQNKPYGLLVRKLDYPTGAAIDELRRMLTSQNGGIRRVALPLLVYRVYPDGREELVRGLRFRSLSTRSFKDIIAASDENYVFDFIDSNGPFASMAAGNFVTSASVIAPAVLFEDLEVEPIQEDVPKPPIVPPPPLSGSAK